MFPAGPAVSQNPAVEQALLQSYAPIYVDCPSDIQWVRPAKGLSDAEAEWVLGRKPVVLDALEDYLRRLGLKDFNVHEFGHRMRQSNYENVPTLGMAISGGGYRSGYTGTGAVRALDSRISGTNEEKIGGLLQSLTYLTGVRTSTSRSCLLQMSQLFRGKFRRLRNRWNQQAKLLTFL